MFPAAISFQLSPNEDRTGRIHTKSILGRDEEDSRSRPLLGRRTDLPRFLSGFTNESPELGVEYPYMVDEASKRSRRHNTDSEEARLLSPSAFSRISETLGALNTVGNFLVNFTRGDTFHHGMNNQNAHAHDVPSAHRVDHLEAESLDDEPPMQMISSSSSDSSVPNAILTLTKTMLGQNVTKTIEPFIKRVGVSNNGEKHEVTTINQNVNTASLLEKKRKKHQAENDNIENHIVSTVAPGEPF